MDANARLHPAGIKPSTTEGDVLTTEGGKVAWQPANGGYREVLMTDGVSNPPEPVWSEDGTDWLYGEALT